MRTRGAVVFVFVAACGGAATAPPSTPTTAAPPAAAAPAEAPSAVPPPSAAPSGELVCDHMLARKAEQCGMFANFEVPRAECVQAFSPSSELFAKYPQMAAMAKCAAANTTCMATLRCIGDNTSSSYDADYVRTHHRACDGDPESQASIGVSRADYAQHNGGALQHFGDVKSTPQAPIERCTIPDANAWLAGLACADGSHPLHDSADAEGTRVNDFPNSGRCHSIVDQYVVTCPEGKTTIYVDEYVCPTD